jgi:hypothetical protein
MEGANHLLKLNPTLRMGMNIIEKMKLSAEEGSRSATEIVSAEHSSEKDKYEKQQSVFSKVNDSKKVDIPKELEAILTELSNRLTVAENKIEQIVNDESDEESV